MRSFYPALLFLIFSELFFLNAPCQVVKTFTIPLKKQPVTPNAGLDENIIARINQSVTREPLAAILQFRTIPTEQQKKTLILNGVRLLNYLGGNAFVVSIKQSLNKDILAAADARSILSLEASEKISPLLESVTTDTLVYASLFSFITNDDAISRLNENGFIAEKAFNNYPVLKLHVSAGRLNELSRFAFIEYIESPPPPFVELNYKSTSGTRANVLRSPDYNLNGEGVVFQVNEVTGFPQDHIDFLDRSINNNVTPGGAYHSTHVHGIIAGAGFRNELYKGYAPKARFNTNFSLDNPADIIAYGADLTNNSYASGSLCSKASPSSDYISSLIVDKQSIEFRSLIHVMAAGNSGSFQCPIFPLGYNTVYSGYQSAKSTLTVGATFANGVLADFSSKGPGRAGRFKPEIVAPGANIISTTPYNSYGADFGTSMACPAVVGGLGLLYQRYQQLHGAKPDNSLMKPLLCNTATDLGPVGPDYGYGFGFMNLNRAIQVLDATNFYKDSVANQKSKSKTIIVPQGIAKLKLMLYWQDPPASAFTTKPLVNDLDIKILTPDGRTVLPYILDTVPSLVMNAARRGVDHSNNIEQVVIDAPVAGNYTIVVDGYEIGEGDQQPFYVVYDLVPDAVQLTFPARGEILAPNDIISVQWDSWGDTNTTYTLEFSPDNGNSWQTISSSLTSTSFDWTVPSIVTNEARLRITRNSDGKTSSPGNFRITGVPELKLSSLQCPGSIAIEWQKTTGASDYEVMWYHNGDMTTALVTTDTSYVFRNLSEDSVYYVTVRARNNKLPGRRAYALSVQPNKGDCKNPIHDHDLKPQVLLYPLAGRELTSKQLGQEAIRIQIKNLDDDDAAPGFIVAYSVNGKPWVKEIVSNKIAANSKLDYAFQTPFDFSAPGNYVVRLAVTGIADTNNQNDTLVCTVKQLANVPVNLLSGAVDNPASATKRNYTSNYMGLAGLERFDYENISNNLQLQIDYAIAFSYVQFAESAKPQSLTATYNLSLFDTAQQSVELQFNFSHYLQPDSAFDSLLVRGNDSAPWILVQDLLPPDSPRTVNKRFRVPVTDYLKAYGQNFSSSFQVRWALSTFTYSAILDSIKILNKTNDVGLVSVDSLKLYSCNLSNTTPIQVTIQNNNGKSVNNLVVKYRVNKGSIVSETIPLIPALTSLAYKFKQTADLSLTANYTIEAWIENVQDTYSGNDSSSFTLRNQPLVTSFPYVEDFEKNNGGWYVLGTNSTWEWGIPSSPLITSAASGKNAWKTNLDGNYNAQEFSQLYTGCYDFSKLTKPVISISIAMNSDSCLPYCDGMSFQYSINGKDWKAMPLRSIYNWQQQFTAKQYYRWHVASERTMDTFGIVQFRFAFHSDLYNSFEGIGIDDFHVYDSTTIIYDGSSADSDQNVSAGFWTDFKKDGKLLGSIQPSAQSPGTIQLQTFIHRAAVRNFHGQYYLNRNFVFNPSKPLNDSVTLRLYFTDKESDSLLFANQCSNCTRPANAYRFGISYYKSSDVTELDSAIVNNLKGEWNFIPNNKIRIVPFMNGYYAEFKIKDAGELRLSNGGLDGRSDLPVQIEQLSAERFLANTSLQWRTAQEINIDHFDIEMAEGNDAFQSNQFQKIGEVKSKGRSASSQFYNFTDDAPGKKGIRYYRLKNVDAFGNYSYSLAVPVVFNEELKWQVYPNPSNGNYNLIYQSEPGDTIQLKLFNSVGGLMKEMHFTANGFIQKKEIDLSKSIFANGIYILQIRTREKTHALRLVKQ